MREQIENGVYINQEILLKNIDTIYNHYRILESSILDNLPLIVEDQGEIKKPFLKSGGYASATERWINELDSTDWCGTTNISGPFTRVNIRQVKLTERQRLAKALIGMGWEPKEFSPKSGEPILTKKGVPVDTLFSVGSFGNDLATSYVVKHRLDFLSSVRDYLREDGRVSAGALTNATNTGRMTHYAPVVNPPKAKPTVLYGKECREIFAATPGWVMAGYDAEQLQLRMLAHYMGAPPKLTEEIYAGNFHNLIWDSISDWCGDYNTAKNIEYAYIFGARNPKLGSMANKGDLSEGPEKVGEAIRAAINTYIPELGDLVSRVTRASRRGYLVGIDGRMVRMTRSKYGVHEHKALNTLLQGGDVVMKWIWVRCDEIIKSIDGGRWHRWLINMHDEAQSEILPGYRELFKEIVVQVFQEVVEFFELKVRLDCDIKFGPNWAETH